MKLEATPLGQARKAIDAAMSDVGDAMEAWCNERGTDPGGRFPHGDYELTLRPDSASLGFEAVFEFFEDIGPRASLLRARLCAVFEKHGIATVSVVGTNLDSADVEAFTCHCNPADRTGGGHDPKCPEFDPAADAEPRQW